MTVTKVMERMLREACSPSHLEIIDESDQYQLPKNSGKYFRVILVSNEFIGDSPARRQQLVQGFAAPELRHGLILGVSFDIYTDEEWQRANP